MARHNTIDNNIKTNQEMFKISVFNSLNANSDSKSFVNLRAVNGAGRRDYSQQNSDSEHPRNNQIVKANPVKQYKNSAENLNNGFYVSEDFSFELFRKSFDELRELASDSKELSDAINTLEFKILKAQNISIEQKRIFEKQYEELKLQFERYQRNSVPLPEAREDRLPAKAPILYVDWKKLPENRDKTPLDCLKEVWGSYLQSGLLYQDDLRSKNGGLDPKLLVAALNYCYGHQIKNSEWLPPKKSERIAKTSKLLDKKKALQIKSMVNW